MTLVERTAGSPLGLYTACLASTLYLMLPMFNGADVIFRNVLVPIAGQREALLLKTPRNLAKTMVKQLPASRHGEAGEAMRLWTRPSLWSRPRCKRPMMPDRRTI